MKNKPTNTAATLGTIQIAIEEKAQQHANNVVRDYANHLCKVLMNHGLGSAEPRHCGARVNLYEACLPKDTKPLDRHSDAREYEQVLQNIFAAIYQKAFEAETKRLTDEIISKTVVAL